jgi:hypothetical protein
MFLALQQFPSSSSWIDGRDESFLVVTFDIRLHFYQKLTWQCEIFFVSAKMYMVSSLCMTQDENEDYFGSSGCSSGCTNFHPTTPFLFSFLVEAEEENC